MLVSYITYSSDRGPVSFLQLMVLVFVLKSEAEKRGQAPFSTKIMEI
jgi:hypothetical protein